MRLLRCQNLFSIGPSITSQARYFLFVLLLAHLSVYSCFLCLCLQNFLYCINCPSLNLSPICICMNFILFLCMLFSFSTPVSLSCLLVCLFYLVPFYVCLFDCLSCFLCLCVIVWFCLFLCLECYLIRFQHTCFSTLYVCMWICIFFCISLCLYASL